MFSGQLDEAYRWVRLSCSLFVSGGDDDDNDDDDDDDDSGHSLVIDGGCRDDYF